MTVDSLADVCICMTHFVLGGAHEPTDAHTTHRCRVCDNELASISLPVVTVKWTQIGYCDKRNHENHKQLTSQCQVKNGNDLQGKLDRPHLKEKWKLIVCVGIAKVGEKQEIHGLFTH